MSAAKTQTQPQPIERQITLESLELAPVAQSQLFAMEISKEPRKFKTKVCQCGFPGCTIGPWTEQYV
jgi:hypothetical protein